MESFPLPEQEKKKTHFLYPAHQTSLVLACHMTDDGVFWMFLRANKQFNAHGNKLKLSCEIIVYSCIKVLFLNISKKHS